MEPLTVVVHDSDDPFSAGTVQLLSDWSAAGWLGEFALVSVSEVLARGAALAQDRVVLPPTPGRPPVVRQLGRILDGRPLRIAVLDPVGSDASWVVARERRHEAGRLLYDRSSSRVGALDLVIGWHGGHWDPALSTWPGWDTLIAAPQEAYSPAERGLDLHCDPEDPEQVLAVAAHAAAFVATVAALWVGVERSTWDHSDGTDDVRMARAFHIRLDGRPVRELLRDAALSPTSVRAPDAIAAAGTGDFPGLVNGLSKRLVLEPRPPAPAAVPAQRVGARRAIGMLFSFLWQSLLMAPRELSQTILGRMRSRSASRLTNMIFGLDSSKQVTVAGMGAGENTAAAVRLASSSEERLSEILAEMRRLDPSIAPSAVGSSQEVFWRATVDTVLALVGGERRNEVLPVTDEGVVRFFTAEQVAPASTLTWRPDDGVAPPGVSGEVPVHDVLACDDALLELGSLGALDGHWRDEVERNRRDLSRVSQQWRSSFLGQVGLMLSGEMRRYRGLLSERLDQLRAMEEPPNDEAEDLAARLVRFSRITTLVAVAIGALIAVLDATNVVDWKVWAWLPLLILSWLTSLVIGYLGVQHQIFKLVHSAQEQESRTRGIEREIPTLIENLRRLRRTYDQYLVWARILPAFLHEPFGRATEHPSQVSRMAGQVPPCVISGRYQVRDPRAATQQLSALVRDVRTTSASAWGGFLTSVFERLADERPEFQNLVKEDVYGLEDQRLSSVLDVAIRTEADGDVLADELAEQLARTQSRAVLERSDPARVRAVIDECFVVRSVEGRTISGPGTLTEFAPFRAEAFSLAGLDHELTVPDPTLTRRVDSGPAGVEGVLDEVASLLVATRPLAPADLALRPAKEVRDAKPAGPEPAAAGVTF